MFQNIKNLKKGESKKEDVKLIKFEEIKEIFKKFFVKKNILLYVVSLMISMVGFGGGSSLGLAPFALAIVAATLSNGIPIGIVYILTCIGTFIGFGGSGLLTYFITSLVFLVSLYIFKTRIQEDCNEVRKVGKNIIIATLLVQIVPLAFGTFYLYDLLVGIMQAVVTFIFYKIFANAITVVRDYSFKKVFSVEEVIGACLMVAIAFFCIDSNSYFPIFSKKYFMHFISTYFRLEKWNVGRCNRGNNNRNCFGNYRFRRSYNDCSFCYFRFACRLI